jgi:glycosyltransferase involved in cell wall biosynthesis
MRIVAVSWRDLAHPLAGGSELLVDKLLVGLADRGHEVALVCGGPVARRPYPVHQAGGTYSQYLVAPWKCATRFRRADVLIDVSNGVPFFSPLWRRRASVCLALHLHGDQWATRFPRPVAAVARYVERRGIPAVYRRRPFVAISESTAASFRSLGVDPTHITVIEPGVDAPVGPATPTSDAPLFVALNRLVPHKRVDVVLEAWRLVQPVTGGRLIVIGDGPELETLRRLSDGIPGVELRGYLDSEEKARLLGHAWFLVQASSHEGWGIVSLEAAAAGTPTLAVNTPGVRDAVIDGVTGVLVDEATPAAFAAAWTELSSDEPTRIRMGEAARQRARGHTWDLMVDAWLVVLTDEASLGARQLPLVARQRMRPKATNVSEQVE